MPSRRSYLAALCSATATVAGCSTRRIETEDTAGTGTEPETARVELSGSSAPDEDEPDESAETPQSEPTETALDIREFGAAVDGKTDDANAIRRAILSAEDGDTIRFPAGTTLVSTTLNELNAGILLDSSQIPANLTLTGEGKESVVRLADSQPKIHSVFRLVGKEQFDGLSISQLRIDGKRSSQTGVGGHGVLVYNSANATDPADISFRDLWVENCTQTGFTVFRGDVNIQYCTVRNCGIHGVNIGNGVPGSDDVPPVRVSNTFCARNGKPRGTYGINCSGGNILVEDSICSNNGQGTKTTSNSINVTYRRVLLQHNDYYGYTRAGTHTDDRSNVIFDDVMAVANGGGGFRLADDTDYSVPTQIVATRNNGYNVFITHNAGIDANRVWANRAVDSYGIKADTSVGGQIREYFPYRNDEGALHRESNVTIGNLERRDRTELDSTPSLREVGPNVIEWNDNNSEYPNYW
jgi:hypothetical protein